jgi:hypothetical protein
MKKFNSPEPNVVLTKDEIEFLLKSFNKFLELINNIPDKEEGTDLFAEKLLSSDSAQAYDLLKVLMPDEKDETIKKMLKDAAVNANTATKAKIIKPKSHIGNMFRAKNVGANYKGPVSAATRSANKGENSPERKFYNESKKQIKTRLEDLYKKVNAPKTGEIKTLISGMIKTLETALEEITQNTRQIGGGDSLLNNIIDKYVKGHKEIPINKQRLAILFGVTLIVVRVGVYAALASNIGMILAVIKLGLAAIIAPLILLAKIVGGILFGLVGAAGATGATPSTGSSGSSGSSSGSSFWSWSPGGGGVLVSLGQAGLQYMGLKALADMLFRGSIPSDIDQKVTKEYEFVTTRLTTGMRIYNPFFKLNVPFHMLPTPDAIKYIMSFIFFKTPAYEPYGPEVSVLYHDPKFDEEIKNSFSKFQNSIGNDTFNVDGSELPGFIGNLFMGDGLKYKLDSKLMPSGKIEPYKTIIDDRERTWVWYEGGFWCVLTDEDKKKTSTYIGAMGLGLNPFRYTLTIPNRSKEHPAYALNKFIGFRNAVYLSARWKLSKPVGPSQPVVQTNPLLQNPSGQPVVQTNPLHKNPTVQPEKRVENVKYQLPPGWVIDKDDDGNTFYACDAQDRTQWEPPTEECLPLGWKIGYNTLGEKFYACYAQKITQFDRPTEECLPLGWKIGYNKSGKKFYVCNKTGKSQWERPTQPC